MKFNIELDDLSEAAVRSVLRYTSNQNMLKTFMQSNNRKYKVALAQNRHTTRAMRQELAKSDVFDVKLELARNPITEKEILEVLEKDSSKYIANKARRNKLSRFHDLS